MSTTVELRSPVGVLCADQCSHGGSLPHRAKPVPCDLGHLWIPVVVSMHDSIEHFRPNLRDTANHGTPTGDRIQIHAARIALARHLVKWWLEVVSRIVGVDDICTESAGLAVRYTGTSLNVSALSMLSVPTYRDGTCT